MTQIWRELKRVASVWLIVAGHSVAFGSEPRIEIYAASYCSECAKAKFYLNSKHITYVEYDIEHNADYLREFYARGGKGIPYLFVNGRAMHGFDIAQFEQLRKEATEQTEVHQQEINKPDNAGKKN
jgi:glutaredoxin